MKALRFSPGAATVEEVPEPVAAADELLIKPHVVGICHSDQDLLAGRYIIPIEYPRTPGHEWCGTVVATGAAVTGFQPGDRVVGESAHSPTSHYGFTIDGAAAELATFPARFAHKLPAHLDDTAGALVEPFTVAFRAVHVIGGCDASQSVAIIGAGMIGLACLSIVARTGATTIVIDPVPARRTLAERFGADHTVDPGADTVRDAMLAATHGDGADLVLEASGTTDGVALSVEVAGNGARVAIVGINPFGRIPLDAGLINSRQLRLQGINGSPGVWPRAIRWLSRTGVDLRSLVEQQYPLERAVEAVRTQLTTGVRSQLVIE
jgi:L-iditol 2-dehydrogenase